MSDSELLRPTPWDSAVFGLPTFELVDASEAALLETGRQPGHYTVKVDPLADKRLLHQHGFYYCDTLIEPFCNRSLFIHHDSPDATIDPAIALEKILTVCDHNFAFGRFHRDFNLDREAADRRYRQWLAQLHARGGAVGLLYQDEVVGFIAHEGGKLLLHALYPAWQGKGLAKHFWSPLCERLFAAGTDEISSSVSAGNVAVLNLYASLGFRFRHPVDIYHRLMK
ncbi:MAG TPA: GNAT family N-acetyltransferase [Mariprofundaceae bacterium]|nr:GNAT family N-acetyltransferase [Mariprofundaceae bacterium]